MRKTRTSKLKVFITLVCLCGASVLIYSCAQNSGGGSGEKATTMGAGQAN